MKQSIHDRIMAREGAPESGDESPQIPTKTPVNWVRIVLASSIGLIAIAAIGLAAIKLPALEAVFAQGATSEKNADQRLSASPFLDHVAQAGIKSCGTVFPILGQLLANGAEYNAQSQWHSTEPDKHVVQALVGMNYATSAYSGPAVGFVFASPTGSACEGSMVRIAPFPQKCAEIPTTLPPGSTLANTLGRIPVYNIANQGGQVLLLPSDQSCIVISIASAAE